MVDINKYQEKAKVYQGQAEERFYAREATRANIEGTLGRVISGPNDIRF